LRKNQQQPGGAFLVLEQFPDYPQINIKITDSNIIASIENRFEELDDAIGYVLNRRYGKLFSWASKRKYPYKSLKIIVELFINKQIKEIDEKLETTFKQDLIDFVNDRNKVWELADELINSRRMFKRNG